MVDAEEGTQCFLRSGSKRNHDWNECCRIMTGTNVVSALEPRKAKKWNEERGAWAAPVRFPH